MSKRECNMAHKYRTNGSRDHCFHLMQQPFIMPPGAQHAVEACCMCSPDWMRITIPVRFVTDEQKEAMLQHPIFNFAMMGTDKQILLPR